MVEMTAELTEMAQVTAKKSDIYVPNLRDWRVDAGLTQDELAERAGLTRGTIIRAEGGLAVTVATLAKLARALGISVHTLRHTVPTGAGGSTV